MPMRTAGPAPVRLRRFGAALVVLTLALVSLGPFSDAAAATAPPVSPAKAKAGARQALARDLPAKPQSRILAGRYIVELADGVDAADIARDYRHAISVRRRYNAAVTGFAAAMSVETANDLRTDDRVASVEADAELTLSKVQASPTWGLDRIDQRSRPLDDAYVYGSRGSGVAIYVVDTGVYRNHSQFGDRVQRGYDATGSGSTDDCVGHGTHVAGTAAGATFGVAKRAQIVPIRVLNCQGAGTKSQLIAGLDWLVRHHRRGRPAVANLSLGGAASRVVDRAVARVLDDGVTVVAAAGNEGDTWWGNACDYSPARVRRAITVGATNRYDQAPLWSNFGPCLDLFAPGVRILSASPAFRTASATESGTSMAAPLVTGVAARYLSQHPAAGPRRVADVITTQATAGIVTNPGPDTTRRLLHVPTPLPTRLSLSVPGREIPKGKRITVAATLRRATDGAPVAGKTVRVFTRAANRSRWTHLANRTTNGNGRIALRDLPLRATEYLVRHARTATTGASASRVKGVRLNGLVLTKLKLRGDPPDVVLNGDAVTIRGTLIRVWDRAVLTNRRVELQAQSIWETRWRSVASASTNGDGIVRLQHTPTADITYRLRHAPTDRTTAATSGTTEVLVD